MPVEGSSGVASAPCPAHEKNEASDGARAVNRPAQHRRAWLPPDVSWYQANSPCEDTHAVVHDARTGARVIAVFDGHGGSVVARHAANNLPRELLAAVAAAAGGPVRPTPRAVARALARAVRAFDRRLLDLIGSRGLDAKASSNTHHTQPNTQRTQLVLVHCAFSVAWLVL